VDSIKTETNQIVVPASGSGANTERIDKFVVSAELRQDLDSIQYYIFNFQRQDRQTPALYAQFSNELSHIIKKTEIQVKSDPNADPRIMISLEQMKPYVERLKSDNFDEALKMYGFIVQEFSNITQLTKPAN
jgi:hypothetical protein